MGVHYAVRQLAPRRFRQAYALLQAAGLDVSLDEWMTQARAIADGSEKDSSGILCVQCPRGYIYGIAIYGVHERGKLEKVFSVECFVATDYGLSSVTRLLLSSLEERAAQCMCTGISVIFQSLRGCRIIGDTDLPAGILCGAGYAVTKVEFTKRLAHQRSG